MEEEVKESSRLLNDVSAQERLKLIKEERRKQHEERLGQSISNGSWMDETGTLKHFRKYKRSDRDKGQTSTEGTSIS